MEEDLLGILDEEARENLVERAMFEADLQLVLQGDEEAWQDLLAYFAEGAIFENGELFCDIAMLIMRGQGPNDPAYAGICEDLRRYSIEYEEEEA